MLACSMLSEFLTKSLLPNYPSPIIVQSFPLMMTVIGSPWKPHRQENYVPGKGSIIKYVHEYFVDIFLT